MSQYILSFICGSLQWRVQANTAYLARTAPRVPPGKVKTTSPADLLGVGHCSVLCVHHLQSSQPLRRQTIPPLSLGGPAGRVEVTARSWEVAVQHASCVPRRFSRPSLLLALPPWLIDSMGSSQIHTEADQLPSQRLSARLQTTSRDKGAEELPKGLESSAQSVEGVGSGGDLRAVGAKVGGRTSPSRGPFEAHFPCVVCCKAVAGWLYVILRCFPSLSTSPLFSLPCCPGIPPPR